MYWLIPDVDLVFAEKQENGEISINSKMLEALTDKFESKDYDDLIFPSFESCSFTLYKLFSRNPIFDFLKIRENGFILRSCVAFGCDFTKFFPENTTFNSNSINIRDCVLKVVFLDMKGNVIIYEREEILLKILRSKLNKFFDLNKKLELLRFSTLSIASNLQSFNRNNSCHFTASGWLINSDGSKAFLMKHKKLNMWLQPGGHCDGNMNTLYVAKKEVIEESGFTDVESISEDIFDIDCHIIPKTEKIPEHIHYDIRYLFRTNQEMLIGNEESTEVKWITKDENELDYHPGLRRMMKKWKNL